MCITCAIFYSLIPYTGTNNLYIFIYFSPGSIAMTYSKIIFARNTYCEINFEVAFRFPVLFEVESQNHNMFSRSVPPASFQLCNIASDWEGLAHANVNYLAVYPADL